MKRTFSLLLVLTMLSGAAALSVHGLHKLRKRFLDMSFNHDSPMNRGPKAMFWDLIFI